MRWMVLVGLCLGLLGINGLPPRTVLAAQQAIALPPGFTMHTAVSGLRIPTDMAFLPNGDVLVTEKGSGFNAEGTARVRLVRQGVLEKEPILEISTSVQIDSGLQSIALDPDFAQNGYFYLWHATGEGSPGWDGKPVNRLTRYTYDLVTRSVDAASAAIILDDVPWNQIHNGGGLIFDDAGNLFISTGDTAGPLDPARNNAQDYESLGGKLLRIRPQPQGGYTIPQDNPYVGMSDYRPEIYAAGFRNPFRMTRRPSDGALFLNDVGLDTWEEINRVEPGANYGWPAREGPCQLATKGPDCEPAPAEYTDPVFAYPLPETGGAVTTMAFYEGTTFPEAYQNKVFFTDFNNRLLFTADLTQSVATYDGFATETGMYVDMEATSSTIYMLDLTGGAIVNLVYDGAGNQPPIPQLSVTPVLGKAPLTVTLSAEGTYDPDDLGLSYRWDFGDGTEPVETNEFVIQHEYMTDGNYEATLQVFDLRGGESEILNEEITVYSGPLPSVVVDIQQELGRLRYQGGDEIRFRVAREGGTIDLDPVEPYMWDIDLHHNEHTHPVVADYVSDSVTLNIPAESHALEPDIWYEVRLVMKTEAGITVHAANEVHPDLVNIELTSWPGPTALKINQLRQPAGTILPVIINQSYELEAPASLVYDYNVGVFDYWLVTDGWVGAPTGVDSTAPATPTDGEILDSRVVTVTPGTTGKTYIAFYRYSNAAGRQYLPLISADPPQPPVDDEAPAE